MELTYAEAIRLALRTALAEDATTYLMGEDVAVLGGVFGCSRGLQAEFGEHRVFDTPISEGGFLTAAVGSALLGSRPIVEVQFMDFVMVGMDAIANQAAKQHFVSNGQVTVPLVIRVPVGVGPNGAGSIQCQYLHSWFMHIPGLRVVMPTTPQDAYSLLLASIADPNPVLFLEDKQLYGRTGPVDPALRPGRPRGVRVARPGGDLTLVAAGVCVETALEAADQLAERGMDVEVLDARVLAPLDMDTITASVKRTGRLAVVDPGYPVCSLASEVIARVSREAFGALRAAPVSITPPEAPFPWSRHLVPHYLPSAGRIAAAVLPAQGGRPG